jgi:hypothetical protein
MRGLPMDFPKDPKTFSIDDQFLFGPSIMVCPVTEYMLHRPPEPTGLVPAANLRTKEGKPGVLVTHSKDVDYKVPSLERMEPQIDLMWYTGRPDYATESTFSIRWEGKLMPTQSGPHQLHVKSFGARRLFLNGKQRPGCEHGGADNQRPQAVEVEPHRPTIPEYGERQVEPGGDKHEDSHGAAGVLPTDNEQREEQQKKALAGDRVFVPSF